MSTLLASAHVSANIDSHYASSTSIPKSVSVQSNLQSVWSRTLATSPTLSHATVSAYAYDITKHQVIADIDGDLRQTPASVTKMVTSAVALNQLGAAFRYRTEVGIPQSTDSNHPHAIYFIGGGDPLLEANRSTELEAMARKVAQTVKTATQVVGVTDLFKAPEIGLGWTLDDLPADYGAGSSALTVGRSEVQVIATGYTVGRAPSVHLMFNSFAGAPESFHIINHAVTVDSGKLCTLQMTRSLGTDNLVLTGCIPTGTTLSTMLSVENPPLYAATVFQDLLKKYGVHFTEQPTVGTLPTTPTNIVVQHLSKPLSKTLKMQNQYSVNLMAENLYRMMGVHLPANSSETSHSPSSTSVDVESSFLQQSGVSSSEMQLVDGSGLSPLNEMSAQGIVQLLSAVSVKPWFPAYRDSMMKLNDPKNAGILTGRYFPLPSGTSVWVKTGNLSNQWNYAGYAKAENGDLIAFAILNDGPPTSLNDRGGPLDNMIVDVATWPNLPKVPTTGIPVPVTEGATLNADLQRIPASLTKVTSLLTSMQSSGSAFGASIVDTRTGKTVWSVNQDKLLRSGLLPRLTVVSESLQGHQTHPGQATVKVAGSVKGGVLHGSLILSGNHNPTLTSGDLARMATEVKQAGIDRITGPVQYVDQATSSVWPNATVWNDAGRWFAPPTSLLSVNQDQADIVVHSTETGKPAKVTLVPWDAPVHLANHVTVTPTGTQNHISVQLVLGTAKYDVNGTIGPNQTVKFPIAPPDAGHVAAIAFRDALKRAGVQVAQRVMPVSTASGQTVIARIAAPESATEVQSALSDVSSATVTALYASLSTSGKKQVSNSLGTVDQIKDPTAIGLENYATPASFASLLNNTWKQPHETPLKQLLTNTLWWTSSPQVETMAGYVQGTDGHTYAIVAMDSERLWDGHFTPSITYYHVKG